MFTTVQIGNKSVEMVANGATPIRYNNVFRDDFFAAMINEKVAAYTLMKLAYIMAMQAQGADMSKLNEDSYIEWLEQFGANDIAEAAEDIMRVYQGTAKGNVSPK